ncbi:MAG: NAD+ synthetase [Microgenomates group bacterium GW2011_GWC1_44_9]|nr:MAG: NAD+ synthetase [Microgenomates group bacterium GW2011_GWC1_44_9]
MQTKFQVAIAQLDVQAGRPDLNTQKIISEIKKARSKGVDVILFSEMVVSGYLLGDEWENESFIRDLMEYNEDIRKESKDIAVIWGNVCADFDKKGEDGRIRKYNAAHVAQNGQWVKNGVFEGHTFKTLMPKYREFDDERHFYSMAKLAAEKGERLENLLKPFPININGNIVNVGASMCEDMWCDDYSESPIHHLVKNGADVIVNLSSSPWTWRKNDKRHRVVKSLLEKDPIPFLYCNNAGIQNNETTPVLTPTGLTEKQDVVELFNGLCFGIHHFFLSLPRQIAVIGLSGGIDSALVAYLLTRALEPENVYAVNMPSKFNSDLTKNAASVLAKNLGLNYSICPIQDSVDLTLAELKRLKFVRENSSHIETDLEVTSAITENIQARDRSSRILAVIAACLGGVFVNNGNKTETALGYCTLYGDVDGALAPIADIYKNEVYQLARYINELEGREIIPSSILNVVPSAELSADQDVTKGKGDPILYPYHDKLIRSFVEFRSDPERILKLYQDGTLEAELKLESGLVKKYFPTTQEFISDLEHKWKLFKANIFKRIQAPPIIAVSRRAFGFDLREAQNGVYFTRGYQALKEKLLTTL